MKPLEWKLLVSTFLIMLLLAACEKNPTPPDDHSGNPFKLTKGEYPDWCPAGDSIAYVRDGDLWIFDIPGRKKWQVTENATQPSFSPDGKEIAFERDKKIYTINLDTKQEQFLAEGITPSWSENGKWIAFANKTASYTKSDGEFVYGIPTPDSSLYYYDLENKNIIHVTASNYTEMIRFLDHKGHISFFEPEWAERDSTLLFSSEMGIWKIRRFGGGGIPFSKEFHEGLYLNKLLDLTRTNQPAWSQTNHLLAYLRYSILDYTGHITQDIVIDDLKNKLGGGILQYQISHPSWSSGGERIACYREGDVWIYNVKEMVEKILDGIP